VQKKHVKRQLKYLHIKYNTCHILEKKIHMQALNTNTYQPML